MKFKMVFIVFLINFGLSSFALGQKESEAVREMHHDIILLNLVNGLYLSPEQIGDLLPKIQEAEKARQQARSQLAGLEAPLLEAMGEIHEVLVRGDEISDEMKKSFHQLKKRRFEIEDQQGEALQQLELEVSNILTSNQKIVIENYKPCVIPPAEGKIGQDRDSKGSGLVKTLDRLRSMPERRYHQVKEMLADITMEKAERYIGFENDEEKEMYRQQLLETFQLARSMSNKEYLLKKQTMADELIPKELQNHKRRKNQLGRMGRFLLDSALLPLLQQRQQLDG